MEITIFNGKTHYTWTFSIAMLVCQRVVGLQLKSLGFMKQYLMVTEGGNGIVPIEKS
jgi:hypothetical protein